MKFFLSGELDVEIRDAWAPVRQYVEARLNASLSDKEYGSAICSIGIIPMILRPEWQSARKERRLFQRKQRGADYRTAIDFEQFRSGSERVRRRLLVRNIIEAIEDLQRKAGRAFHGHALVEDILALFQYDRATMEME
jgi:hypothetical protein